MIEVVWYKRDLRIKDHAPLYEASKSGLPMLCVYIIEDEYWQLPDTSLRHWKFIAESLKDLYVALGSLNISFIVCRGEVKDVLNQIDHVYGIHSVYAHEETGNQWTFTRDIQIKKLLKNKGIAFREFRQFGVKRPLLNRDDWQGFRTQWQNQSLAPSPTKKKALAKFDEVTHQIAIHNLSKLSLGDNQMLCEYQQKGGLKRGNEILHDFLYKRGYRYHGGISKPDAAIFSCSRLSPYLTYGCISLREVIQQTSTRKDQSVGQPQWRRSLSSFESRLYWHCHFIQKLEDQPSIEFECMHHGFEGMRNQETLDFH